METLHASQPAVEDTPQTASPTTLGQSLNTLFKSVLLLQNSAAAMSTDFRKYGTEVLNLFVKCENVNKVETLAQSLGVSNDVVGKMVVVGLMSRPGIDITTSGDYFAVVDALTGYDFTTLSEMKDGKVVKASPFATLLTSVGGAKTTSDALRFVINKTTKVKKTSVAKDATVLATSRVELALKSIELVDTDLLNKLIKSAQAVVKSRK